MTFMTAIDAARRPRRCVSARPRPAAPGVVRPMAGGLCLSWKPAADGRGLVAAWHEAPAPWFAPVSLRAARPSPRSRRPASMASMRLPGRTRLAAA